MKLDILVIGAGPAGLTAALYLARFRRQVAIVEHGRSRARFIPISRNDPGFDDGIGGDELLRRMRRQVGGYGTKIHSMTVERISRDARGTFRVRGGATEVQASNVLLTTGVTDVIPPGQPVLDAIRRGILRLCPICDGYETQHRRVAVFGTSADAVRHAHFLRSFTPRVHVLISETDGALEGPRRSDDHEADGIVVERGRWTLDVEGDTAVCTNGWGERRSFDAVYVTLGARPNTGMVESLGVRCDDLGYLQTDPDQRTSVPGLYAVGDVACSLNQICVATGQAAIAASAIHRRLPFRPYAP